MVYQEQIMQTAQILAGYSLGGADLLRRAMGKKDMKKMAQEREKFIKGADEISQHSGEESLRGVRRDGEVCRSTASTAPTPPLTPWWPTRPVT